MRSITNRPFVRVFGISISRGCEMLLDPRTESALDRGVVCSGNSPVWRTTSPTSAFGFAVQDFHALGLGLMVLALAMQERLLTALVVNETEAGADLHHLCISVHNDLCGHVRQVVCQVPQYLKLCCSTVGLVATFQTARTK